MVGKWQIYLIVGRLGDNSAPFVLNLKDQFQRNLPLYRYVSRKRTRKKEVIVPYLFSVNPLINPRGTCFFEYPTSGSRAWMDIKNRTAWESGRAALGGVGTQRNLARPIAWSLHRSSVFTYWFPLRLCSEHEDYNVSENYSVYRLP